MGSQESRPVQTTEKAQEVGKTVNPSTHETGLRGARTTTLFRAVNFELFVKPNKVVMAFGLIALTGSVAYIAYMNAVKENQKDQMMYEQYFEDGSTLMKPKKSKWE
ncbi:putative small integral membrane protein 8 isoform X2 [Apostichopus japonicus]|uniref:Small integral membrane protein 8 n=1 Tax=Stichopus japonicus TaxID=307972 RepID=A0A2G8KJB1_STIJA|nr:putative small integral membrane protein 8 isoform X2 [Apostichopus japonicus]